MSLALAAFLLAAAPPPAANAPQETVYFACTAGFTFRTFAPPRTDGSAASRPGQPAGASCTRQRAAGPVICPTGFKLQSVRGPDQCVSLGTVSRNGSIGAISDGTSNTVIASETPPPTGSTATAGSATGNVKQLGVGASPQPGCTAGGTVNIDGRGLTDQCTVTDVRPPSERVTTMPLLPLAEQSSTNSDF